MRESCDETIMSLFVDAGYSIPRIAAALDLDIADVCHALHADYLLHPLPPEASLRGTSRCQNLTPERRQQIDDAYHAGISVFEIAHQVGCALSTVYRRTEIYREPQWRT